MYLTPELLPPLSQYLKMSSWSCHTPRVHISALSRSCLAPLNIFFSFSLSLSLFIFVFYPVDGVFRARRFPGR